MASVWCLSQPKSDHFLTVRDHTIEKSSLGRNSQSVRTARSLGLTNLIIALVTDQLSTMSSSSLHYISYLLVLAASQGGHHSPVSPCHLTFLDKTEYIYSCQS